ncbi:MAG: DUF995 domain-containing protein [Proteobacteria bacterium]|nr:DUF995 domain-containing protein [Pseudomonadota bacterium]
MTLKPILTAITCALLLSGCASLNVFKDNKSDSSMSSQNDLQPSDTLSPGTMSASQIKGILSGKSWKWSSPRNSGVTLYADDGSSLVEVTGKGTTTGKWTVKDGQLCESFSPAPFLPNGVPMTCQPFSGSGSTYRVGQATFTLA